ncbi:MULTISPECIES: CmpA/NrtA family ABC transporter substrate-binding protein [Thalassolituus]|jgi:nitrate/nitrite transport system substrate-binding protein|uniref:CmpA/NrtA family ABC transporter substrate-binding protein n=1 Tax=Thalassolituus TaxID=187492 RepID=UPI00042DC778|nr:CmpA/NrtA family ABC transporter substrate-binding protein [Thalassolituus oleivorans]AHK16073.1 nitrate-binding protein NasS [Thalassolituus oleivorans R6-15]MCA6129236.1 hypothetical protein [Thalassolituus oleivorans 4BN06-13]
MIEQQAMTKNNVATSGLEQPNLKIGYMPLSDSLPLLVADEMGFFAREGLSVELQQEVSWANIRDKVLVGHLDAAQMLAPMLLATHLGIGGLRKPMQTAFAMGLNGNAFTISNNLAAELAATDIHDISGNAKQALDALKTVISQRKTENKPTLIFAIVFPFSIHNFLLRDWLASAGINPDSDVQLVVLPPSQMVDHLALQHIDGFFAGAPWNTVAIQRGVGECLVSGPDLWSNAPDKVLGTTQQWANDNPNTLNSMIRALYQACAWADANRDDAAKLLAKHIHLPVDAVQPALSGKFVYRKRQPATQVDDMLVFNRYHANYPWPEHGQWFLSQMQRWGWAANDLDNDAIVNECYATATYRAALADQALPPTSHQLRFDIQQAWELADTAMGATGFKYR